MQQCRAPGGGLADPSQGLRVGFARIVVSELEVRRTETLCESGMKWLNSSANRDRTLSEGLVVRRGEEAKSTLAQKAAQNAALWSGPTRGG